MALGDSSPFAPVDLLGGMVLNALATNMACKDADFRVGIKITTKNDQGQEVKETPAYLDYRFLGGLAAAVAGQLVPNPMHRRIGHDMASGLLNSFVATETCRRHALERGGASAEGAASAAPAAQSKQIASERGGGGNTISGQAQHAGATNYAYGW